VILGPMFSGKTTRLLQLVDQFSPRFDRRVVIAKWASDLRSGSNFAIATHDGRQVSEYVQSFSSLDNLELFEAPMLIAVDEGQFFGDDVLRLWQRVAQRGDHDFLFVAGLDLDFKRRNFGRMLDLLESADEHQVEWKTARCFQCGKPAKFTMRIINVEDQVLVGGSDAYRPACERHHNIPCE